MNRASGLRNAADPTSKATVCLSEASDSTDKPDSLAPAGHPKDSIPLPTFIVQVLSALLLLKLVQLVAHVQSESLETRNAKLLLWLLLKGITNDLMDEEYQDVQALPKAELKEIERVLVLVVRLAVPALRQAIKEDGEQGPVCGRVLHALLLGPLPSFCRTVATEIINTGKSPSYPYQCLPL